MKHRIQITSSLRVSVEYAYDVEYDTETGEAEILSDGHAQSHPDTLSRRQLMRRIDFDDVDDGALVKLIDEGKIERPAVNETFMHRGKHHLINSNLLGLDFDDEGELDPEEIAKLSGEDIVGALVDADRRRRARRTKRRAYKRVAR